MEVMMLNTDPGEYFIKGHGYKDDDIITELKNHIRKQFTMTEKKESWCHWCYGINNSIDVIPVRYVLMDDKYKGVRGGFPVTFVHVSIQS
jgi:hypothetical protein